MIHGWKNTCIHTWSPKLLTYTQYQSWSTDWTTPALIKHAICLTDVSSCSARETRPCYHMPTSESSCLHQELKKVHLIHRLEYVGWPCPSPSLQCEQVHHCLCLTELCQVHVFFPSNILQVVKPLIALVFSSWAAAMVAMSPAHSSLWQSFCGNHVIKREGCVTASLEPPMWALAEAGREDQDVSSNKPEETMAWCCCCCHEAITEKPLPKRAVKRYQSFG